MQITKCNFNNCYWIPVKLIQSFLNKCVNLNTLHVTGTQLTSSQLALILTKCIHVSELSLTFQADDLWKNKNVKHPLRNFKRGTPIRSLLHSSHFTFSECEAVLKNITKLEITSSDIIPEILAFLRLG